MNRTDLMVVMGIILGMTSLQADEPVAKFPEWWFRVDPVAPFARDVQMSAQGNRLVVGWGPGVHLWNLANGNSLSLHADNERWVYTPRFSPDGRWVVGIRGSEPDWQLVVWDAATGKEVWAETKVTRKPSDYWRPSVLGIDPDGGVWVTRPSGVVERMEIPTRKVSRTIKLPFTAGARGRLVLSPDGQWLALGGGTVFATRSTAADAEWVVIERHAEPEASEDLPQPTRCPVPCQYSTDGTRLVTYDHVGDTVAVWDMTGKPVRMISRKAELTAWTHPEDLRFMTDNKRFAFIFTRGPWRRGDSELRVWDANTLKEVSRLAPTIGPDGFAFTPDGKRVVLTHRDGSLTVHKLDVGK